MKLVDRTLALATVLAIFATGNLFASPTDVLPLSGMGERGEAPVLWQFKLDRGRGSGAWRKIRVPSCWEQEGFGAYYYGGQGRHRPDDDPIIPKERGTYKRTFVIPAAWNDREVHIVFDGVMTDTTVRINGQVAGDTHQGGFYRFSYNISSLVKIGANDIEVDVEKESANKSVNFAERRGDYWTFGGIYRPVWIEARPSTHLENVAIDARADGTFYARVQLNRGSEKAAVTVQVLGPTGQVFGKAIEGTAIRDDLFTIRGRFDAPNQWTAETPHLYVAKFSLTTNNGTHEVQERFGFRTLEVRPRDGVYLNGRKIVLKGINRHSFSSKTGRTLSREDSVGDIRLMKEANMNAVRMSHYPPDKHFLETADELGLYVLDELAGWQGSYDTATATRLIGQIVRRDVNHPSVLFWDNGNEGGWNREADGVFDQWDPQRRPVLHPWGIHSGINTDHYENYASTVRLSKGPDIFMPTEFLHGLYDGGIGAGLEDYWNVMKKSHTVAGGFFWAFSDEGIRRTDQNQRIDNMGNLAPDGMLGPDREKEGSFFAVKQIWSPIQVGDMKLAGGKLIVHLENGYDFTDLAQCKFKWRVRRLPDSDLGQTAQTLAEGSSPGRALSPGAQTSWSMPVPIDSLGPQDVLELSAFDVMERELWTWSLVGATPSASANVAIASSPHRTNADGSEVTAGPYRLRFDPATGRLREIRGFGRSVTIEGPRIAAYRRQERQFIELADESDKRILNEPSGSPGVIAEMGGNGFLRKVVWSLRGDELVLNYEIEYSGPIDILGIQFDYPREAIMEKRWAGMGPYRTWQNRQQGTKYDVHEVKNQTSVPGERYAYPEFDGFFGAWRWLDLRTQNTSLIVRNRSGVPFHGLYGAIPGIKPVIELPRTDLSFLHVIPAIGTKFDLPEVLGPQSQTQTVSGTFSGEISLSLRPRS